MRLKLNDKLFYSKHTGKTVKYIIDNDPTFIYVLLLNGAIRLSISAYSYYREQFKMLHV